MSECSVNRYYQEERNGEVISTEYGHAACSRFRRDSLVIEHLWVTNYDDGYETAFSSLIEASMNRARELNCRYLKYAIFLSEPAIHQLHRQLVGLGFYPVQSPTNMVEYEQRVRTD